jgi:hypothetical protein
MPTSAPSVRVHDPDRLFAVVHFSAIDDKRLGATDLLVILALKRYADFTTGASYPSLATLSRTARLKDGSKKTETGKAIPGHYRALKKSLARLVELGYLETARKPGRSYLFILKRPADPSTLADPDFQAVGYTVRRKIPQAIHSPAVSPPDTPHAQRGDTPTPSVGTTPHAQRGGNYSYLNDRQERISDPSTKGTRKIQNPKRPDLKPATCGRCHQLVRTELARNESGQLTGFRYLCGCTIQSDASGPDPERVEGVASV